MKKQFIIIVLVAVTLLSSTAANAQNAVDSLFFRDGRVEGVIVSRSTSDMIQFSYPNETLQNEMRKSELLRIKYASGRIEQLSVLEDALPVPEPEFVGEAYLIGENNDYSLLDKEVAQTKYGPRNKYKIRGREANLQIDNTGTMSFVVRANDNESVPMSIITMYKFRRSGTKRKVVVGRHETGLSETVKKFEMPFTAEKYGKSSYFLTATDYANGEYGITVNNPNNVDEKKKIFNCIGVGNHQPKQPKQPKQHKFIWYQGEVNVGGAFGKRTNNGFGEDGYAHTEKLTNIGISLSTVHGIRISKYGFVGVGAEYTSMLIGDEIWWDDDYLGLAIFPNLKGYLPINDRMEAYASVSVGGQILNKGVYAETGVGFNYGHLNVMLGYQHWNMNNCHGFYDYYISKDDWGEGYCTVNSKCDAFVLKVGVRF